MKFCSFPCALWGRIEIRGPDECWPWLAYKDKDGYGLIPVWGAGTVARVSRILYRMVYGQLQVGEEVCHSCDSPSCCNPSHFFPGSRLDNNNDAVAKGRKGYLGEQNANAILTDRKVCLLRSMSFDLISKKDAANLFGISLDTIRYFESSFLEASK